MVDTRINTRLSLIILAIVGFGIIGTPYLLNRSVNGQAAQLGFDLSYSLIPTAEIRSGGPPKDGIPALTEPKVTPAQEAKYLQSRDLVIGVKIKQEARAYPLRILDLHEVINDRLGNQPILISYCPLCHSALVFDRQFGSETREFGVSGLLWNSNVLMYDRQKSPADESLWSQVQMRAVTGPAAQLNLKLKLLPSTLTTWQEWQESDPNSTVLSTQTGHQRNYKFNPYAKYFRSDRLMFPIRHLREKPKRFRQKEPMVLVQVNRQSKAYAVRDIALTAGKKRWMEDAVGGMKIRLHYSDRRHNVRVETADKTKRPVPTAYMYWFALSAELPDVPVYQPPDSILIQKKKIPYR